MKLRMAVDNPGVETYPYVEYRLFVLDNVSNYQEWKPKFDIFMFIGRHHDGDYIVFVSQPRIFALQVSV